MSYQALARKWRPQMFAQLMGQEHVVAALSNALSNDRLHHAYLFTGTRGVGKTTIARIFAKSLNCENGVTAEPCGQCQHCVAIEEGRFVDLVEVDAASRTKVEDTREILDNVQYKPTQGRYKVYLIDEVHMLSRHSFNALLKTLEEPPPHIKFLLATTDPQKLPVTILSRCLQFSLKAMTLTQIENQLEKILNAEQIQFEPSALNVLAKAANGSMRDSLSLTDQAVAQGNGRLIEANVRDMLGLLDEQHTARLLSAILANDLEQAMQAIEALSQAAVDSEQVLIELMNAFHQIALIQSLPAYAKLNDALSEILTQAAQSWPEEQVQLYYQVCLRGRRDLPFAAHPRAGLEMTIMRLFAFNPVSIEREEVFTAKKQIKKPEASVEVPLETISATQDELQTPVSDIEDTSVNVDSAEVENVEVDNVEAETEESKSGELTAALSDSAEASQDIETNHHIDASSAEPATLNEAEYKPFENSSEQNQIEAEPQQAESLPETSSEHNALPTNVDDKPAFSETGFADEPLVPDFAGSDESAKLAELNSQQDQILSLAQGQKEAGQPATPNIELAEQSVESGTAEVGIDAVRPETVTEPGSSDVVDNLTEHELNQTATDETEQAQTLDYADPDLPYEEYADYAIYDQQIDSDTDSAQAYQDYAAGFDSDTPTQPQASAIELADAEPVSESLSNVLSSIRQTKADKRELNNQSLETEEFDPNQVANLATLSNELQTSSAELQAGETDNSSEESAKQAIEIDTDWMPSQEQAQKDQAARKQSAQFNQLDIANRVKSGLRKAYQMDSWAELIERLALTGLQRQFALHSTYQLDNGVVRLNLAETQQHLDTDHNKKILADKLSQVLNQPVKIEVTIVSGVSTTPYQIQQEIEDCRLDYAHELIDSDSQVQALLAQFSGQLVPDSIQAV